MALVFQRLMEIIVTLRVSSSSLGIVSPLARSSVHPQPGRSLGHERYFIEEFFVDYLHCAINTRKIIEIM